MARGRRGRRPRLPARPRRAVGGGEGLLVLPCRARCCSRASTRWRRPARTSFFEGVDRAPTRSRSPCRTSWSTAAVDGRASHGRRTPPCGRTPPRSWSTGRSSRCPTTSARRCSAIEYYRLVRGERGPPGGGAARLGGRPLRRARPDEVPTGAGAERLAAGVARLGVAGLAGAGRGLLAAAARRRGAGARVGRRRRRRQPAAAHLALRLSGSRAGRRPAGASRGWWSPWRR